LLADGSFAQDFERSAVATKPRSRDERKVVGPVQFPGTVNSWLLIPYTFKWGL